jgi:hypothetical protein
MTAARQTKLDSRAHARALANERDIAKRQAAYANWQAETSIRATRTDERARTAALSRLTSDEQFSVRSRLTLGDLINTSDSLTVDELHERLIEQYRLRVQAA